MLAAGLPYLIYYEPAFYSLRFPKIELELSDVTSILGEQAFELQIYSDAGYLQQMSDPLDEAFLLDLERVHSFLFTEYVGWARCMAEVGCVEKSTSLEEHNALLAFYESFGGEEWRFYDNWLVGDPCVNQWYGVGCNTEGQVISLHFFENHLVGESFPEEIYDLVHLKHLSIFNGDTEYEGRDNLNKNKIEYMISSLASFTDLEELNLAWLGMTGVIPSDISELTKLKFLNLSNNALNKKFTQDYSKLTRLEIIEIQHNELNG